MSFWKNSGYNIGISKKNYGFLKKTRSIFLKIDLSFFFLRTIYLSEFFFRVFFCQFTIGNWLSKMILLRVFWRIFHIFFATRNVYVWTQQLRYQQNICSWKQLLQYLYISNDVTRNLCISSTTGFRQNSNICISCTNLMIFQNITIYYCRHVFSMYSRNKQTNLSAHQC